MYILASSSAITIISVDSHLGTPEQFYQTNWVDFLQPNAISFLTALGAITVIKSIIFK